MSIRTHVWMVLPLVLAVGCASAPQRREERQAFEAQANATLQRMKIADPTLQVALDNAYGYVVFPTVGEVGAFLVGGAQGMGIVYEGGVPIGYARLRRAQVGPQLGGESFAQIILIQDRATMDRLRSGNLDLTAGAQATALGSGVGAYTQFENGTSVIVDSERGALIGAHVGGQQISFEPLV